MIDCVIIRWLLRSSEQQPSLCELNFSRYWLFIAHPLGCLLLAFSSAKWDLLLSLSLSWCGLQGREEVREVEEMHSGPKFWAKMLTLPPRGVTWAVHPTVLWYRLLLTCGISRLPKSTTALIACKVYMLHVKKKNRFFFFSRTCWVTFLRHSHGNVLEPKKKKQNTVA